MYDEAGQLIKEINGADYTEYAYDSKGNISTRKVYSNNTLVSTDNFTYGSETWEDRLTGYNNKTITYDSIGNPTSYLGATLTWRGRELESYTNGNIQISYSYDVDGMRYQKVVKTNGVETSRYDYVYSEGTLVLVTFTADGVSDTARFIYDSYGEPRGFILNDTAAYLYIKNAQGDITGIVDENGEVILTCSYDAWGRVNFGSTNMTHMTLAAKLSQINPFTYRGYCYDYDIGMYYLQSRYYDPEICRFINADSTDYLGATGTLLSYNLFAYCENDGVNGVDPSGFYDAKKAVEYAKEWTGGVNNTPDAIYHNEAFRFYESGDCINFVSQCLYAGGLLMNEQWYSYKYTPTLLGKTSFKRTYIYYTVSKAWRRISSFIPYIESSNWYSRKIYFYITKNSSESERRKLFLRYSDLVEAGAVLLMDLKFDGKVDYGHAAIVVRVTLNDIKYAAHTSNRWWQSLWQMIKNGKVERYIIYNISPNAK